MIVVSSSPIVSRKGKGSSRRGRDERQGRPSLRRRSGGRKRPESRRSSRSQRHRRPTSGCRRRLRRPCRCRSGTRGCLRTVFFLFAFEREVSESFASFFFLPRSLRREGNRLVARKSPRDWGYSRWRASMHAKAPLFPWKQSGGPCPSSTRRREHEREARARNVLGTLRRHATKRRDANTRLTTTVHEFDCFSRSLSSFSSRSVPSHSSVSNVPRRRLPQGTASRRGTLPQQLQPYRREAKHSERQRALSSMTSSESATSSPCSSSRASSRAAACPAGSSCCSWRVERSAFEVFSGGRASAEGVGGNRMRRKCFLLTICVSSLLALCSRSCFSKPPPKATSPLFPRFLSL